MKVLVLKDSCALFFVSMQSGGHKRGSEARGWLEKNSSKAPMFLRGVNMCLVKNHLRWCRCPAPSLMLMHLQHHLCITITTQTPYTSKCLLGQFPWWKLLLEGKDYNRDNLLWHNHRKFCRKFWSLLWPHDFAAGSLEILLPTFIVFSIMFLQ